MKRFTIILVGLLCLVCATGCMRNRGSAAPTQVAAPHDATQGDQAAASCGAAQSKCGSCGGCGHCCKCEGCSGCSAKKKGESGGCMGKAGNAKGDITAVQEALRDQGARITVDGKMGAQTVKLLRKYQELHGLPVTGKPDKRTMAALKITPKSSQCSSM